MSCTDVQTIQAGNGTKTQFSFDFPYIFKSEIHVYFWNATTKEWDEKLTTDATHPWRITDANPTIVEFTSTAPPSPATPVDPGEPTVDNVRIRRITNIDDIRALFNPGSAIRSDDLNNNFEQLRYAIQEANCQGVPEDIQSYLEEYYWDRFDNTLYSADTWRSDDATIATTAALDQRFQDEVAETITSTESWPSNDDTVGTTLAVENRVTAKIDDAITNDIGADSSGITVTDDGDGTITLSIEDGDLALTKIDPNAVITSAETWANNDDTIATTAKIDDVIDDAITGDILIDSTGLTKSTSGGQTTLGIGAGSVDIDRIKAENIITEAEQDSGTTETDDNLFTAVAAAKRFDTLVQTNNPGTTTNWEVGKTWLQNDDDLTLSIFNGTGWTAVTSGGTFTEQPSVVYVDQASGDDNNTGHRISTPKATIRAAINQINAEIDVEITNGGSGYVESTYNGVSLTGGTGTGLTADIVVNASGVVTTVTVNNTTTLEDYNIGDVLSANNADLGGSGSGLQITVTGDGDGQIVVVSAGTYQEIAPIQIKRRNVSVIGQAMRSCIVHPTSATELNTLFELNSGSYIANLTLTGMQAGTGTGNTLDAVLPTDQGWNFAFYNNAFITKSPYIQNCTNFSDSEIDNDDLRSHRPRGGQAGDTDSAPTGGGLLVNGATPHADSPLRSMVADSYTHVALNGPGILVTNNGYTQITSSYAFFNTYHIKCLNGGQANLAASTTDFGDRSLIADGRSTTNIFTADCVTQANVNDTTIRVSNGVADASWHGTSTRPATNMLLSVNSDAQVYPILGAVPQDQATFDADPAGYTGDWIVTISRPDPNNRSNNLGFSAQVNTGTNNVQFWLRSMIASSGHTMEYVGSGTNYTALPENGGVPDETRQITESNNGKVWTAITDHNGKFRIGGNQTDDPIFEVDQQLGFVTIPEGSIAFNLLSDETPQLGGNLDVNGNTITSTSNANVVIDPNGTGTVDVSTSRITSVTDPTSAQDAATKNYVDTTTTANPIYVAVAGDTMSGELAMGTNKITGLGDPTANQDAATKAYVDTEVGAIGTPSSISTLNTSVATSDTGTDGTITFTTDGTTAMTVDNNQRVGVGTASFPDPGAGLNLANGFLYLYDPQDATDAGRSIKFATNGGATGRAQVEIKGLQNASGTGGGYFTVLTMPAGGTSRQERLRIDSSGRVGIGTSSPSSTAGGLDISSGGIGLVVGADGSVSTRTNSTDKIFRVGSAHHTNAEEPVCIAFGQNLSSDNELNFGGGTAALNAATYIRFFTAANNTTTSGTERMRITSAGNVGIGTTSPTSTLSLGGNLDFQQSANLTTTTGFLNVAATSTLILDGADTHFRIGGSEKARIDSSGRLLVGTSSSRGNNFNSSSGGDMQLQVEGTDYKTSGASFTSNSTSATYGPHIVLNRSRGSTIGSNTLVNNGDLLGAIVFEGSDGNEFVQAANITAYVDGIPGANDMPGRLVFSTTPDGASSPTERMRINREGTLITYGSTSDANVYNLLFYNSSSVDLFRVRNDGYFLTGSASLSPYNLTTGSAANVNIDANGGLQRVTSSLKYKRDVEDAIHGLSEVLQLRAVTYKGKGENDGDTVFGGLIAEEVHDVGLTEFVQYALDGSPDSLAYGNMVSLCVKAIQEQQAIINGLEARLSALEAQ